MKKDGWEKDQKERMKKDCITRRRIRKEEIKQDCMAGRRIRKKE